MKFILLLNRYLLNITSYIAPQFAKRRAVGIFTKVRKKSIREKEKVFFDKASKFELEREGENLTCYELGNPEGKLLFLVHGWESNPGCFTQFLPHLSKYRIISFTLPGHADNKAEHTNMYECKDAFKLLLNKIQPTEPFHVVAHSMGSAITAFALSELEYEVDKLVFLSANNDIEQVFIDFQKLVGFNSKVFGLIEDYIEELSGISLQDMRVDMRLEQVKFNELLLIHDKFDKIIPYKKSVELSEKFSNSKLIPFEKIGHYRMLWNEEVLEEVLRF